jgi:translation initiation factor 2B subunit (eIF-2B alpha/beta/delta family)
MEAKVGITAKNATDKSGYFFPRDAYMKQIEVEDLPLKKNEIRQSRDDKEMKKSELIRKMDNELNKNKPTNFTIPPLIMKVNKQVFSGLKCVFDQIREYQNMDDDLFYTDDNVQYMNNFIDYVKMKLQKHISEKMCQVKKPGISNRTFTDLKRKKLISAIHENIKEGIEEAVTDLEKDIRNI